MDLHGYALGVATILLVAYVVPYLYRRRTILSDARIEERYAEDLRMLEVPDSRKGHANADTVGSHGTVFFRQPEVIMSQSDKARVKKAASAQAGSPSDVRALAKERARRRARISKRRANRQRGALGAGLSTVLCIVLWVLVGVTSLSVVVAGIGTALSVAYLAGFGYVASAMAQATAADEEAITKIDRKLKSSKGAAHLARSRRPVAPKVANRPAGGRPEARVARATKPGATSDDSAQRENGRDSGVDQRSEARGSVSQKNVDRQQVDRQAEESVKKLLGTPAEDGAKVNAQWPKTSQSAVSHDHVNEASVRPKDRSRVGTGLAISLEPEIIEDSGEIDVISSDQSETRPVARSSSPVAASSTTTASASVSSSPSRAEAEFVESDGAQVADASVPSYTAKPRQIERRVVTPYEAPQEPESAVPYRPKDVGERFDEEPESNKPKSGADGLTGGSALDALLDRRRA